MKLYKTKVDEEIFYYFLKSGEKRFMYRHKYYDSLGKRREKKKSSFTSEKAALRELLQVKSDLLNGRSHQIQHNHITVSQWLDIWYDTYSNGWEVTTRILRKGTIEDQLKPLIGRYKLSELDKTTYIRAYINPLLKKHKPGTVTLFHRIFKIAINAAVEDEIIPRNRFNKVTIEQGEELDNFLDPEELNVLLDAAKRYENITNYTFVMLLAYTGMRKGEAFGLKWGNIDFNEKSISIECTRDKFGERSPKTKNSNRTIPIDSVLISLLSTYQKWCVETKFAYGMKLDKKNDYVFISYQGGTPIGDNTPNYILRRLYGHLEKENIRIKQITPHGLRHTHATILINSGIPPKTIADRLGNTVEMIYRVYAHSFREIENRAVTAFHDSLIGAKIGANQ